MAGSVGWTPAFARETGFWWVVEYENGVGDFVSPPLLLGWLGVPVHMRKVKRVSVGLGVWE